jgi:Transient receptor potential (TRP) ion channel
VGCIQSGITNGKTLEMPQVANAAMGVAASALALSGVSALASAGFVGAAPSTIGFGTVLGWFQTIAVTGMMSVNYPPIYRSFSKNFAFSTGLVSWEPMQASIDNFRNRTGGNLTEDNVQFLKNTTLSFSDGQPGSPGILGRGLEAKAAGLLYDARSLSLTSSNDTSAKNESETAHIVHGIGAFAEELMIPQSNIFT